MRFLLFINNKFSIFAPYYIVSEQSTRDREFGPLEKIRDNHPKYVISATPLLTQRDENGITHLSLRKFLKEGL